MKKAMQESVILIGFSEERFKKFLSSAMNEYFENWGKGILKSSKDEEELMTIPASAKFLNKTPRTIYNWIDQGVLKRYYIQDSPYLKRSDLINLPKIKIQENEKE